MGTKKIQPTNPDTRVAAKSANAAKVGRKALGFRGP